MFMQTSIVINNHEQPIREYNGQRVVTFKDIDTVHGRPDGTARKRFNDNKKHFIEGEDYFKICASEIRARKIMALSPKAHEDITLLTESGYLLLVKSFTDDFAWKVQRELVNSYFRVKENIAEAQATPYEYFDKTYNGEPVLSLADVEYFTKLSRYQCLKVIKKSSLPVAYYHLYGNNLMTFKDENPRINKLISEMYDVYYYKNRI